MTKKDVVAVVLRSALAGSTAAAATVDPILGVVSAAALPVVDDGVTRIVNWRRDKQSRVLERARDSSGVGPETLLEALTSTPARLALLGEALSAAEETALDAKLDALGEALGRAVLGEDPVVESERRWVALMSNVERFHLHALDYLARRTSLYVGPAPLRGEHPESDLPDLLYEVDLIDDLLGAGMDPTLSGVFLDDLVSGGLVEREGATRNLKTIQPIRNQGSDDIRRLLGLKLVRLTPAGLEIYRRFRTRGQQEVGLPPT